MTRFESAAGRVMRAFTLVCFGAICLLMIASVVNRFMPIGSMGWSDEIVELLLVWTLFIGIAEVWRQGQHFRVGVIPDLLRGTALGSVISVSTLVGCLVFLLVFVWYSSDLMVQANDVSPIFSWSRRWWYLPMPVAGAVMSLVTLKDLFTQLRQPTRSPDAPRHINTPRVHAHE